MVRFKNVCVDAASVGKKHVVRCCLPFGLLLAGLLVAPQAYAQRPWPGSGYQQPQSTGFMPGGYNQVGRVGGLGVHHNPVTNSLYMPNVGVLKSSGLYTPIGNGYYQNARTGNVYSPDTGSYSTGKQIEFRPGGYNYQGGNTYHNPVTNSTHIPNVGVIKDSGFYRPIGGGYYENPLTGNIYNPTTAIYKRR